MFDKDGGRVIYFEGTYTHTFSGNPEPTPRYDYNQIMYRLDLADPRLALPVPVYSLSTGDVPERFGTAAANGKTRKRRKVAFLAPDRDAKGNDSHLSVGARGRPLPDAPPEPGACPAVPRLPADDERTRRPPPWRCPNEFRHGDGGGAYSTDKDWSA